MITRVRFREAVTVGIRSTLEIEASEEVPIRATAIGIAVGTTMLVPWANVRDVAGDFAKLASVGERKA